MKNEELNIKLKSDMMPKQNEKSSVRRMMGLIVILILHSSFLTLHSSAQTFTDRLRQYEDGKGRVTITQSAEVEDLVNNAVLVPRQQPAPQQQQGTQQNQPAQQRQTQQYVQPQSQTVQSQTPDVPSIPRTSTTPSTQNNNTSTNVKPQQQQQNTDTEETTVDTRKKVIKGGHKVQGYRVQVFSGGNSRTDRQKAERIGATMKSHFPDQPVYVHFYSPSWKCRMGNYRTAEEARLILSQVKQLGYSSACIVKGTITVP
jgi:FtsZ-interacting cell division protein ZipA